MHQPLLEFHVPNRWSGWRHTVACAVAFLCLHAAGTLLFPFAPTGISYAFLTIAPVCALVACAVYAAGSSGQLRTNWLLVVDGLALWAMAMGISAWGDMVTHANRNVAFLSDFVYFFYGVPILFASPSRQRVTTHGHLPGSMDRRL